MKNCLIILTSFFLVLTSCQNKQSSLRLTYLGTAGWVISDESSKVLIDPYLSRIKLVGMSTSSKISKSAQSRDWGSDNRKEYNRDDRFEPDTTVINWMLNNHVIDSSNYIFVHHTHFDHAADVPYIAKKTGARVIGTESLSNLLRAHGVPDKQIITVEGGEDYDFEDFSVKVLPSLHSALRDKKYFSSENISSNIKVPMQIKEYVEGGSLMFFFRFKNHKVLTMGSMNFIENEIDGLRPDILLAGSANSRKEIFNYTKRLLKSTGFPKTVIPTHWDDFRVKYDAPQEKALKAKALPFVEDVNKISPRTNIIVPQHLVPIVVN